MRDSIADASNSLIFLGALQSLDFIVMALRSSASDALGSLTIASFLFGASYLVNDHPRATILTTLALFLPAALFVPGFLFKGLLLKAIIAIVLVRALLRVSRAERLKKSLLNPAARS